MFNFFGKAECAAKCSALLVCLPTFNASMHFVKTKKAVYLLRYTTFI